MKIDFTVTKRDKKILVGLAVCAVAFGIYWFGVKPVRERIDKLELQQEQLEMDQLQMQVDIAALPVDEKRAEEQKKQLDEMETHFFTYQANEELNRYLTDVFVSEGMIMQDSTLRAGQTDEISPYSLSERMKLVKAAEKNSQSTQTAQQSASSDNVEGMTNASNQNDKNAATTQTNYVYSAQADYSAIGTKEQALAVLDTLSAKEGVRIVSFSISDAAVKTQQNGQDSLQEGKRLEVSMMIYMIRGNSDGK